MIPHHDPEPASGPACPSLGPAPDHLHHSATNSTFFGSPNVHLPLRHFHPGFHDYKDYDDSAHRQIHIAPDGDSDTSTGYRNHAPHEHTDHGGREKKNYEASGTHLDAIVVVGGGGGIPCSSAPMLTPPCGEFTDTGGAAPDGGGATPPLPGVTSSPLLRRSRRELLRLLCPLLLLRSRSRWW